MKQASVLILGATSDIGWAIADRYRAQGSHLLLAGRNKTALEDRVKNAGWSNVSVLTFEATDFEAHKAWFAALPSIPEVTVCVFGYLGDQQKAEKEWSEARQIIDTNYTGCVSILNVVAEVYKQKKSGTIVGISSVAGERGRQSNFIYGSAKAGFTAYLSGLRNRLFPSGVKVVTVKPGFVYTRMTAGLKLPASLTAKPEQVASRVVSAAKSGKSVVYVLPIWAIVMLVIRTIPEFIFKRMKL